MRKVAVLFLLLLVAVFFLYQVLKEKVGDIRPALLPINNSLPQQLNDSQKIGESPSIPLRLPKGSSIGVFSDDTPGARDLQIAPQGTILVSLPNMGEIAALPDNNNDGVADEKKTIISSLDRPHGLAIFNGKLFVAEETRVSRYSLNETSLTATFEKKLFDLPAGGRHRTRSIVFDREGNLYVSLGSTCDTCVEDHPFISTILISDSNESAPKVFAKGLRNAVFLALNPTTNEVWATEMGRDFLGDNLPPDEVNIIKSGGNYGWPFCYGNKVWDRSFNRENQTFCNSTIAPFYEIPAHSAPLGITFINSPQLPEEWQGDILVAYHGSWNRSVPTGYKIVRITTNGTPTQHDFISGFISGSQALGRPVDMEFDRSGNLYISDDKAGAVYKMIKN